jgi:hypothetical protein
MVTKISLPVVEATEIVNQLPRDINLLTKNGITQTELANQLGVDTRTIRRWLKGNCQPEEPFQVMSIFLCANKLRVQSGLASTSCLALLLVVTSTFMLIQRLI